MKNAVSYLYKIFDKIESEITIELEEIIYSKKHGHEICVMRLIGKNSFPKMTTEEILSNPKAMTGLSKEDIVTITRLDVEIKNKKNKLRIVEIDRNSIVLLENGLNERQASSIKTISSNVEVQDKLNGRDAFRIGYKAGMKEGLKISQKCHLSIRNMISRLKVYIFPKNK